MLLHKNEEGNSELTELLLNLQLSEKSKCKAMDAENFLTYFMRPNLENFPT